MKRTCWSTLAVGSYATKTADDLLFSELQKNFPRMNRINVLSFYEFESKNPLCWGVESLVLLGKNPLYICMSKPLVFPLAEESTYLRSS